MRPQLLIKETKRERRVYRSWSLMQHIRGTQSKAAFCPDSSKCASYSVWVCMFSICTIPWIPAPDQQLEVSVASFFLWPDIRWVCSHTSAPSSITPVSIMGTSLSSTWTSRMVLSMWDRLTGSRLQGTQRWTTYGERVRLVGN